MLPDWFVTWRATTPLSQSARLPTVSLTTNADGRHQNPRHSRRNRHPPQRRRIIDYDINRVYRAEGSDRTVQQRTSQQRCRDTRASRWPCLWSRWPSWSSRLRNESIDREPSGYSYNGDPGKRNSSRYRPGHPRCSRPPTCGYVTRGEHVGLETNA